MSLMIKSLDLLVMSIRKFIMEFFTYRFRPELYKRTVIVYSNFLDRVTVRVVKPHQDRIRLLQNDIIVNVENFNYLEKIT